MMSMTGIHRSVLLQPALDGLQLTAGDVFVDATLGEGGHTKAVCEQWGSDIALVGIDQDSASLRRAEANLADSGCDITFIQGNFRHIDTLCYEHGVQKVTKVLYDLGWSSDQFVMSGRGFSFQKDEPLIMTLHTDTSDERLTAREIVNTWEEENIVMILRGYGEERYARRIAHAIVEYREHKDIETTFELVEIIQNATPESYHRQRLHPARRTFQALRIAVNDELGALEDSLDKAFAMIPTGGRIAVISFHSLEDRIVKRLIRAHHDAGTGLRVYKKPVVPSDAEIDINPRARSAKLRVIEKL